MNVSISLFLVLGLGGCAILIAALVLVVWAIMHDRKRS